MIYIIFFKKAHNNDNDQMNISEYFKIIRDTIHLKYHFPRTDIESLEILAL
jgi:hypothetical protein